MNICHLYLDGDLYEIYLTGTIIVRIYKYSGDSQQRREVQFDELDVKKQWEIASGVSDFLNGV